MYPDLYILRHGETLWNREGRMQGHLNSPLTDKGEAQARQQGRILAGRNLAGFGYYTSPLGRAVQTAALALGEIADQIRTDDRLREIDVGVWQGKLRCDFAGDSIDDGPDGDLTVYANAPGEGLAALSVRAKAFLDDLNGPAVLVCHGIVSRTLRSIALGMGPDGWRDVAGGQGNVFYLSQGQMQELH